MCASNESLSTRLTDTWLHSPAGLERHFDDWISRLRISEHTSDASTTSTIDITIRTETLAFCLDYCTTPARLKFNRLSNTAS